MMRGAIVAGLLAVALPAWGQSLDWKAVDDCYRRSAVELDDMTSDAETIGNVVSFICLSSELQMLRGGRTTQETTQAHLDMRTTFQARATTAVLVRRVMIRKGELKP